MPLDTTRYDEATQQLRDAKHILIEKGWCRHERENWIGEHCALGALDAVIREEATGCHLAVIRLADAIPAKIKQPERTNAWYPKGPDWDVAAFNNSQRDIDSIIEWFDRAIAPPPNVG